MFNTDKFCVNVADFSCYVILQQRNFGHIIVKRKTNKTNCMGSRSCVMEREQGLSQSIIRQLISICSYSLHMLLLPGISAQPLLLMQLLLSPLPSPPSEIKKKLS